MFKKFAYHAGDFKHKYGTLRQGLSGTSFVSGYFYTTVKEICEYQGAGFNLDHKRPIYQFSLEGLNLIPLTAEDCRTLNLYNKVCYNYPIYYKYNKEDCYIIKQKLDKCFEDFYCDSVTDDKKPVKFFRELSDFYNSDKESFQDEDYNFQTFIDSYLSLKRLKESLENSDQLPYLKQILELNEFVFTDNQEFVDELDDFLYNVDLAYRLSVMVEKVAKLLHKSSEFISDKVFEMYEKYEAYYRNGRFDNFSAPEDDLFATQLLKKLNYVGTYPIGEIADSTEFGSCIFDIENIKNKKLIENTKVCKSKSFKESKVFKSNYNEAFKQKVSENRGNFMKIKENRLVNNDFVPEVTENFLKDVAQYSSLYTYSDIIAFERDVFSPKDKNVKALKQLYKQAKEAAEYDDEEELKKIYQEVADIVTGVDDRNPESWCNESYKSEKSKLGLLENVEKLTREEEQFLVTRLAYDHDEIYEDIMQDYDSSSKNWYKTMEIALRKFLIKEAKKGFDIEHDFDFEEKLENLAKKGY